MKSVMSHNFATAPSVGTPRSQFNRSFGYKTSFDAGWLIPFYIDDVLPGDTFTCNTQGFARLTTPLQPIMDNMFMDTHYFFVPLRLIWTNFRKFMGEQNNPGDSISYVLPTMTPFTPAALSLHDYMGLPVGKVQSPVSLYHRAYNFIYNEWFRDQNLQNMVTHNTGDGPDAAASYSLLRRGKRHDYFTSCLPWPQKGNAVNVPIGSMAPVRTSVVDNITGAQPGMKFFTTAGFLPTSQVLGTSGTTGLAGNTGTAATINNAIYPTNLYADLTQAVAASVNDLRQAFQVQKLFERDARGGTRYSEIVLNHFGVNFNDLTYRPEYLGGGSTPVIINQVANTSGTVGELGAYGVAAFKGHGFTKSFNEHGIVMGIVSVRADLTYQQGMHRRFSKSTRYDIYWPSLAHLGEQAVLNKELYFNADANDNLVFGYQERYAEYRYYPSQATAMLRSSYATPLDSWHLAQSFSSLPVLGASFIVEDPPLDRCVAAPSEHHFIFDSYTDLRCARPMPVYSVPGYIDHF